MKKIIVASKNPVKIAAVETAYNKLFPKMKFSIKGVAVPSEVSDQPMTDMETLAGATNRVRNARQAFSEADYWVGIEGGIEQMGEEMAAFAWIVVEGKDKNGKAKTGLFFLPPPVVQLINAGKELGEADDIVFGHSNSKQKGGAVGLLTNNVMNRTSLYVSGVILALLPFKNPELY